MPSPTVRDLRESRLIDGAEKHQRHVQLVRSLRTPAASRHERVDAAGGRGARALGIGPQRKEEPARGPSHAERPTSAGLEQTGERVRHGLAANRVAIAAEVLAPGAYGRALRALHRPREPHRADRLFRRAAGRAPRCR